MKVLVTGGSGFLGSRTVARLLSDGHQVRILDIVPSAIPGVDTVVGDICSAADCSRAIAGCDVVFHVAALYRDDVRPTSRYFEVNVEGTRRVLEAATDANVHRIVFVSSFSVYGLENTTAGEEGPFAPVNHYGRSKLEAERHLQSWVATDTRRTLAMIRPCVIFGEGNRGNVFVLLQQIASGRFLLLGDGSNVKSMSYVDNVAAFLARLVNTPANRVEIFNYADKPDMTVREIVELVGEALGRKVPRIPLPRAAILLLGRCADLVSRVVGRPLTVNSERVRKFIADTRLPTDRLGATGFVAPCELRGALQRTVVTEFAPVARSRF